LHRVLWLVCADARQREQELLWAASSTLHAQEQGGVDEVASAGEAIRGEGEGGRGCCIVIDSFQTFYDVASGDADAVRGGTTNPCPGAPGLERIGRYTQHSGQK
jgi:hypothetical protein